MRFSAVSEIALAFFSEYLLCISLIVKARSDYKLATFLALSVSKAVPYEDSFDATTVTLILD